MKRLLLLAALTISSLAAKSQTKNVTISECKIGKISCKYYQTIDIESNDTTKIITLYFQNMKYQSIIDGKIILLYVSKNEHVEFLKDLQNARTEMDNKDAITWSKDDYILSTKFLMNTLFIANASNGSMDGYTALSKNKVSELINWIQNIK